MRKVIAPLNSVQVQHYTSHMSCLRKISPYLKYRGTFLTLCFNHLTRDNTFSLIRSCGKGVYNVEKSKEDT